MHRRKILGAAISSLGALFAGSRARAAGDGASGSGLKVVYHLNEIDKVGFVLGNIQNHYDGVGGPDHVTIALVVHGPALRAFTSGAAQDIKTRVGHFSKAGLELAACGNTMKAQNITLRPSARLRRGGKGRRGADRGAAIQGLCLFAAVTRGAARSPGSSTSPLGFNQDQSNMNGVIPPGDA